MLFEGIFVFTWSFGLLILGILGAIAVGGDGGLLLGIGGVIGFFLAIGFGAMAGESLDQWLDRRRHPISKSNCQ